MRAPGKTKGLKKELPETLQQYEFLIYFFDFRR